MANLITIIDQFVHQLEDEGYPTQAILEEMEYFIELCRELDGQ